MNSALVNIIFGMKVRQARNAVGLNLSEFAAACELSPSYVTEIEKGRKYPRADKIMRIAQVLNKEYDELVSIKLPQSLAHLETALSSTILMDFPFEEFGFEAGDIVNMLTRQPDKASALIHALIEIGRRYDVRESTFMRAALRSYQELNENYFPDLEEKAAELIKQYGFSKLPISCETIEQVLSDEFGIVADYDDLVTKPELAHYRSVFLDGIRPTVLVNGKMSLAQRKFTLMRELAYKVLDIKERNYTYAPERADSFEQVLGDFRASYLAGAMLIPRAEIQNDIAAFFDLPQWEYKPLLKMLKKYDVSPEALLYRFAQVIPEYFGIKLHFLRFHTTDRDPYQLTKELNLNQLIVPTGIGLNEHYCRRWLSIRLLEDLSNDQSSHITDDGLAVSVQMSEFLNTQDRFLCIGFGRTPSNLSGQSTSSIVGFRVGPDLHHTIRFMHDPKIMRLLIDQTCERCTLSAAQCSDRAAEPIIVQQQEASRQRRKALRQLMTKHSG